MRKKRRNKAKYYLKQIGQLLRIIIMTTAAQTGGHCDGQGVTCLYRNPQGSLQHSQKPVTRLLPDSEAIHNLTPYLRSVLVLSSHLFIDLYSDFFLSGFATTIACSWKLVRAQLCKRRSLYHPHFPVAPLNEAVETEPQPYSL